MQIHVKCGCDRKDCSDWALLELQGVLEIQASAQHLPLHSLPVGSLCSTQQVNMSHTIIPLSLIHEKFYKKEEAFI